MYTGSWTGVAGVVGADSVATFVDGGGAMGADSVTFVDGGGVDSVATFVDGGGAVGVDAVAMFVGGGGGTGAITLDAASVGTDPAFTLRIFSRFCFKTPPPKSYSATT